ncbi:MAG: M18 family aminopeptidase [Clostridia bacterium]|nr:M18 family aminopeptidase [Clostridia bacterium]
MNVEMLLDLIEKTPTAWHAAANTEEILLKAGFQKIAQSDVDCLGAGDWFTGRNGTSLIAFRIPENMDPNTVCFRISAVHGDSPCFRLKPNAKKGGSCGRLNTERYGGGILSTWLDIPLALAGRVTVRTEAGMKTELLYVDKPVAVIPNVAIHLSRDTNIATALNPAVDLVPLFSDGDYSPEDLIAETLQVKKEDVLGWDLSLVAQGRGFTFGKDGEFVTAPRLDDLECAYTCLDGFLSATIPANTVPVYALFDNEEVGSLSFAGAAGTLLKDVIARILPEEHQRQGALARSFFVSADNAHALHPNHPELYDGDNAPKMNGGVVVKYNAMQKYVSDGFSGAIFTEICRRANVPVQVFANRSDKLGGSTLGNLAEAQVPLRGVDIGAAQLAMHSAHETAGSRDVDYMGKAMTAFYSADFSLSEDGIQWN